MSDPALIYAAAFSGAGGLLIGAIAILVLTKQWQESRKQEFEVDHGTTLVTRGTDNTYGVQRRDNKQPLKTTAVTNFGLASDDEDNRGYMLDRHGKASMLNVFDKDSVEEQIPREVYHDCVISEPEKVKQNTNTEEHQPYHLPKEPKIRPKPGKASSKIANSASLVRRAVQKGPLGSFIRRGTKSDGIQLQKTGRASIENLKGLQIPESPDVTDANISVC